MIRFLFLALLSVFVLFWTTVNATADELTVEVLNAPGAKCRGTNGAGHTYEWARTPGVVTVEEVHGPLTITCAHEGFEPGTVTVDPVPNVGAEVLVFGVLGAALLAQASGNLIYESPVKLFLKPDATASREIQAEYERLLADHEAEEDWDE